jgi:hypothetical protein
MLKMSARTLHYYFSNERGTIKANSLLGFADYIAFYIS